MKKRKNKNEERRKNKTPHEVFLCLVINFENISISSVLERVQQPLHVVLGFVIEVTVQVHQGKRPPGRMLEDGKRGGRVRESRGKLKWLQENGYKRREGGVLNSFLHILHLARSAVCL